MRQRPCRIWGPACRCLAVLAAALLVSCGGGGGAPGGGTVIPAPAITSFAAARSTLTAGSGTVITAVFTGAASASVDQGVGPVTSGAGFSVSPLTTTTYTLTASGTGAPATRSLTVTVVPPAGIASFSASPAAVAAGSASQLTAVFSGGTGSIDQGIGAVASGVPVDTGAILAPTTYTLTVTNPAGDSATSPLLVQPTFLVTFVPSPGGALQGSLTQTALMGAACSAVTAAPAPGYSFTGWTGAGFAPSAQNPLTVANVSRNLTLTANFAINAYTLSYAAGPNGSIAGPTPQAVTYGGSGAAVTALPATGYHFVQWSDGSVVNPRTDAAVAGDISVTASFAINAYTLTYAAGPNGAIAGPTPQAVTYGGSAAAVTALPASGHAFLDWTGTGGFATTSANPLTVSGVTSDMTITANFAALYAVTFAAGPNGSLTGPANQTIVAGGSAARVTAVPDAGYGFLGWTGTGGFAATPANPLDLAGVNAAMTITANFAHLPVISSFTAFAATIGRGQAANLSWNALGFTTSASIDNGGGPVSTGNSSIQLYPVSTTTYTLTAVNAAGSTSRSVLITVVPPPSITSFTATPTALAAGQTTTLAWSATGATSFSIDHGVGSVAGNSVDVVPPLGTTVYRLTASSTYGSASTAVSVTSGPPAALTYSVNPAVYSRNVAIPANTPSNTGGPISSYIVVPALPFGLALDPATGAITGTPTSVRAGQTYTVRGSNAYGNSQVSLDLTVNEQPPAVTYPGGPYSFSVGVPVLLTPASTGGPVASWSIAPALPAGLAFNPANGQISGTPTTVTSIQGYTVSAVNTGGSAAPVLSINVYQSAPIISYPSASYAFWLGVPVPPVVPALSGGPVSTWSISPALPAGLTFDTATGQISGIPGATAPARVYTISAANQGGTATATPTLSVAVQPPAISAQPFGQILAPGDLPSFSVTATGSGALSYQWRRNGVAVDGATSSTYTAPTFQAADDGTVYTVMVSDSYGGATASAPAVLSLLHDLTAWLNAHPAIAAAIKWQFKTADPYNNYLAPADTDKVAWAAWSAAQRAELNQAYLDAASWYSQGMAPVTMVPGGPGLTDQPVNLSPALNDDTSPTFEKVSPAYMWQLYLGHVAFTLMLETSNQLPWSVTDYPAASLRWLFDSATMAWYVPDGSYWMGTYEGAWLPALRADNRPRTSFADPRWTYRWLRQAGIIGGTRLATIGGTLDWMRHNMSHFYGSDVFGNDWAIWQYRGWSPLSRIVAGTIDSSAPADGVQHWTAGCHGSTGFVNAALRAVNIPVEPVWVAGHELMHYLSEDLYLDHGDDPYNSNVKGSILPSLGLLIDSATWRARFGPDETVNIVDPNSPAAAWIGYSAAHFH